MAFLPSLALRCLRSPLALSNSFQGAEFSTADGKALCCLMCCGAERADAGAPRRPCPLTCGLCGEGGSSRADLRGLQGRPWTWAVASLHKPSRLRPGKAWLSPSLLMTDILADCCTLTSTNPRGAVGFGPEDYRGENSSQKGLQWCICYCCSPASAKSTASCGGDSGFLFPKN